MIYIDRIVRRLSRDAYLDTLHAWATVLTMPLWFPLGTILMGLGAVIGRLWSMFRYGLSVD